MTRIEKDTFDIFAKTQKLVDLKVAFGEDELDKALKARRCRPGEPGL